MHVAQTSATAFEQGYKLAVLHDIAQKFACLGIVCYCAAWNIHNFTLAVGACTLVYSAILTIACEYMTLVFEMQECPVIPVSAQDNIASFASVATVGTAIGNIFCTVQMRHTTTAPTRAAYYLYIIYEIRFCHKVAFY